MKVLPTNNRSAIRLFAFFLALVFVSFHSLQAQDYVSANVAKTRLATEADQLDEQLAQGNISQLNYNIKKKFLKVTVDKFGNHDFTWTSEHKDKIASIFGDILDAAQTATLQDYPTQSNQINTIKEELDALLQQ